MASVVVYYAQGNKRSELIAQASYRGLKRLGEKVLLHSSRQYRGVIADYAVFYGLANGLDTIFKEYREEAAAVYIDLGYWTRRIRTRYDGFHKVAVNARHPTDYFQNERHTTNRFLNLKIDIDKWRRNEDGPILLAGMSWKAARAENQSHMAWERDTVATLLGYTNRPIHFRPKPNCMRSRPIQGTVWAKSRDLLPSLLHSNCVVTHHSNVAVDAILRGIPIYCEEGVGRAMSMHSLCEIETLRYPTFEERLQWAADIAWTQFTPAEMERGLPFKHLKNEGLIP